MPHRTQPYRNRQHIAQRDGTKPSVTAILTFSTINNTTNQSTQPSTHLAAVPRLICLRSTSPSDRLFQWPPSVPLHRNSTMQARQAVICLRSNDMVSAEPSRTTTRDTRPKVPTASQFDTPASLTPVCRDVESREWFFDFQPSPRPGSPWDLSSACLLAEDDRFIRGLDDWYVDI